MSRAVIVASALAMLAVLFWSGNWVLGRAVRADIPPLALNFWRWSLAAVLLAPFAIPKLRAEYAALRSGWLVIVGLALSGAAVFQSMVYIGLRSTEAINALLLNATGPVFVILIAWGALGQRTTARQLSGIAVSFIGAVYLVARGDLSGIFSVQFNIGDVWILAAMVVWGVYSVLLMLKPAGVSPVVLVFCISVGGALFMLPLWLWEGVPVALNGSTLLSVGYTGVFASVLAFLAFNAAVARIGPSRAVYFLHLMPVFGAVLAILFLGEKLQPYHLIGFPIALTGVLWATS
ncbi:MAG: DMT family transporter, partial [Paracoccaceae bacterium]